MFYFYGEDLEVFDVFTKNLREFIRLNCMFYFNDLHSQQFFDDMVSNFEALCKLRARRKNDYPLSPRQARRYNQNITINNN